MERWIQWLAVVAVVLCIIPAGAHFFELPGKLALSREDYFSAQPIYNGWALFGIAQLAAVILTALLAFLRRDNRVEMLGAAGCCVLVLATLVLFFAYVYPANVATNNWTQQPENWSALRSQWETMHAVDAALTFIGFLLLAGSIIFVRPDAAAR